MVRSIFVAYAEGNVNMKMGESDVTDEKQSGANLVVEAVPETKSTNLDFMC